MIVSPITRIAHIPVEMPNRPGRKIVPRFVTCHETANTQAGATAEMHRRYTSMGGGPQLTSYNYVVDDQEIIELVPVGESSNHAGTSAGNLSGVSMELCVNSDGNFQRTTARAIDLIEWLCRTVPSLAEQVRLVPLAEVIVQHHHWRQDTACPARLRAFDGAGWRQLMATLESRLLAGPDNDDAELEARYQAVAHEVGAKRFAAILTRDFYSGRVLVCDRGIVTQTGQDIMGHLMDDWQDGQFGSGTLRRL